MNKPATTGQINFLASLGVTPAQMPATAEAASVKIKSLLDQRYLTLHTQQQWNAIQALDGRDLYGITKRDASVAIQFLQLLKAWRETDDEAALSPVVQAIIELAEKTFVDESKVAKRLARGVVVTETEAAPM